VPSEVEIEIRNRTRLARAAYRYEMRPDLPPVMDDVEWDSLAKKIRPEIETGDKELDDFYKYRFTSDTGMWIREYPKLDELILLDLRIVRLEQSHEI